MTFMPPHTQVTVLRFIGPRFEDHGLDVDVLPEIVAYKRLLQETAKEIWRRDHPKRRRLPRRFDADVSLKFFNLEPGSTGVPLMRETRKDISIVGLIENELDEAAIVLEDAIRAAAQRETAPSRLPRSVIPLFGELGKTLREDEFLFIAARTVREAVRFDDTVKKRILAWAEGPYTDVVDLTGEVRATDLDGLRFTLRLRDGQKIVGRFTPDYERVLLEALGEHTSRRIRVVGRGEFASEDGTPRQIVDVERIELIEPEVTSDGDVPIWDRLASIGQAVPDSAWNDVPTDLATNVDHYLYGSRKDRH